MVNMRPIKSEWAPAVRTFRSPTDLQADVPSDLPHHVAGAVDRVVQRTLDHVAGIWKVSLRRGPDYERWRLELRGPTGRHIWLFMSRVDTLTEIVADKLTTFVQAATVTYQRRQSMPDAIPRT